jgi:tRNA ligase
MAPQISGDDSQLITNLHKLSAKSPKLVKSSTYPAPAAPEIIVRSWKMNEFKYYDVPSPFPTLARGLFSTEVPVDGETKYRIVARGYDKFFNIGEVPWTTVSQATFCDGNDQFRHN